MWNLINKSITDVKGKRYGVYWPISFAILIPLAMLVILALIILTILTIEPGLYETVVKHNRYISYLWALSAFMVFTPLWFGSYKVTSEISKGNKIDENTGFLNKKFIPKFLIYTFFNLTFISLLNFRVNFFTVIINVIVQIMLMFTYLAILNTEGSIIEAVKLSFSISKKNFMKVIGCYISSNLPLGLSGALISILYGWSKSLLLFFTVPLIIATSIFLIWFLPIRFMIVSNFYHKYSGQTETPESELA